MSNTRPNEPDNPESKKDEDAVAFLQGLFELARNGGTGPLNVMLDAGVPVDIRTSTGDTLLMLACRNGHKDTLKMLLERGANPNLPDHQSETPLMAVKALGREDLAECLIDAGAH